MGYLFLGLVLLVGAVKGYCGKKTSYAIVTSSDSMIMNVLRMTASIVTGFLLLAAQRDLGALKPDGILLAGSLLSGLATAAFVVSWLLSVRSGAFMMVEVFLLAGVIVPIVLCRIFFAEAIGIWQVIGIVLLAAAVYIMCTYNSSLKGKMGKSAFLLLILCGLSSGMADFSQKLFVKLSPDGSAAAFNLYTYMFAALALLGVYLLIRRADEKKGEHPRHPLAVIRPIWYYVLIMAVSLFAHSFFKTQAAYYLDAVQLYPLSQGGAVILSLLMSAIFFKEKITGKCLAGIALSFVALLMINLL